LPPNSGVEAVEKAPRLFCVGASARNPGQIYLTPQRRHMKTLSHTVSSSFNAQSIVLLVLSKRFQEFASGFPGQPFQSTFSGA